MWTLLLAGLASAQSPIGLEGGVSLGMPHAGLGPAPGFRALVDVEVAETVWVGGEGDLRLPGAAKVDLSAPELVNDVEIRTGQTGLALGARAAWTPGDAEGLRWRLGGALGATRLIQAVTSDAGTSREAASTLWLRPEGGILYAFGKSHLTASLYWSLAPARLDVLDGGGNVLGILVGFRHELNR